MVMTVTYFLDSFGMMYSCVCFLLSMFVVWCVYVAGTLYVCTI